MTRVAAGRRTGMVSPSGAVDISVDPPGGPAVDGMGQPELSTANRPSPTETTAATITPSAADLVDISRTCRVVHRTHSTY
jgi:hypothetical protein